MLQAAWARFAHKAVLEHANVRPGEVFTVLTDDRVPPEIAEAVFAAGLCQTSQTQLIVMRAYHSSEEPFHLSRAVAAALRESDVVLSVCDTRIGQTAEHYEALEAGTRILLTEPGPRPGFLIDGVLNVDYEKMIGNVELFCDLWRQGKTCKVTSETGTDLEFEVGDRPVRASRGAVSEPGEREFFPGAMAGVHRIGTGMNGTIAVDGSLFPFGVPDELVMLELEKGVIKNISGGLFAMRWEAWMESLNDELVYQADHVNVGFNPRAEITGWTHEDERPVGAITVGFGGTRMGGKVHVDVVLQPPMIVVGDKVILKDRVLNTELGFVNL